MKKNHVCVWIAAVGVLLSALALGGVTYAWFTFQPYTNVEPLHSTVSDGEVALLIANDPEEGFGTSCSLLPGNGKLEPVSTADLKIFSRGLCYDLQGIMNTYGDAASVLEECTIHGTLYLQSLSDNCLVFLNTPGVSFGEDVQMLSALRLGLLITIGEQEYTYILKLDSLKSTGDAAFRQTTSATDVVVAEVDEQGKPRYVPDPAVGIERYSGQEQMALCTLDNGEIARVEYRLYLEGCDPNCIESVQNRETWVQLSFVGSVPGE